MTDADAIIDWIDEGIEKGYCVPLACQTHERHEYLTNDEAEALLDGEDPCVFVVRVLTT